jgi:paraquat-inducible protein B
MTASRQRNAAWIGAFVLGGIALLVVGILLFGSARWFVPANRAVIYFDQSIAGLQIGAPVTFGGVTVGSVERIAVNIDSTSFDAVSSVFVVLQPTDIIIDGVPRSTVGSTVAELVARGLRATLELQSLITGQLRVELSFRPNAEPVAPRALLRDVPEIPAVRSELEQLREGLSELPLAEIAALVQRVLIRVEELTEDLQPLIEGAEAELGEVGSSVRDAADAAASFARTGEASVRAIEGELMVTLADLRELLMAGKAEISGVGTAVERIGETAARIEDVARDLDAVLDPNGAERRQLQIALRDLAATATSLKEFARQIERNPNALVLGTRE